MVQQLFNLIQRNRSFANLARLGTLLQYIINALGISRLIVRIKNYGGPPEIRWPIVDLRFFITGKIHNLVQ